MTESVNYLDKLAILQVDFDIWSGQVKLDDPDIKLGEGGELPPKELADLGRKYVIDREHLRPFHRVKTSARRLCLAHGKPFMSGFAVPIDKVGQISRALDGMAGEMNAIKATFLAHYDQWVDEWEAKNPEYAHAIRTDALPRTVVASRIGFRYAAFQLNPVSEGEARKLNTMAGSLAGELMDEIVAEANAFFQNNLKGREACKGNTRKTLQRLRDKVDGLSFLDRRFAAVVEIMDRAIGSYPAGGKVIDGEPFFRVLAATLILSSREKIEEYAAGALEMDRMANGFFLGGAPDTRAIPVAANAAETEEEPAEAGDSLEFPSEDELDAFFNNKGAANSGSMFF